MDNIKMELKELDCEYVDWTGSEFVSVMGICEPLWTQRGKLFTS
jgi:hypothetical protein